MEFDLESLRKRTKSQWSSLVKEQFTQIRIWIQENAEKGFITALLLGLVIALAFRLILTIAVIAGVAAGVIWYFAPGDAPSGGNTSKDSSEGPRAS